jgi:hypothetical protein
VKGIYQYDMGRLLFYDQEMIERDSKRLAAKGKSGTPRRTQTAQPSNRQAQELETQAERERGLAAKVTDPKVRGMISNSAVGKVERAQELKTGRPVKASRYETRLEHSQPHRTTVTTRK